MNYGDVCLPDRFWSKVCPEPNTGCWLWIGSTMKGGHGQMGVSSRRKLVLVHRLSLIKATGFEIRSLLACHTCNTPPCVNPDHLYWGTYADNARDKTRDGNNPNANKAHCSKGHEFTLGNTIRRPEGGRRCLICHRANSAVRARRYRARLKQVLKGSK